ncbi:MAG: ABC transporter permease [Flavobacteriales bacterium]|jgi:putative ABC transport system permease protein|nr:ABC transporter permease [Flavobacteriales bacterium]
MFDKEKWLEILQSIGQNKLRTALTGFAVFWGIFMLIILLGLGSGLRNGFAYNFSGTAQNSIGIWGGETSKPWNGLPPNRQVQLTEGDVAALRHSVPGVRAIYGSYRVWRGNSQLQYGTNYGSYNIHGVESDHQKIRPKTIEQGRFVNEVDEAQVRKVIVLAADAVKELFKDEAPLDKWVNVNGVPFQVVGVYRFDNASQGGRMGRNPVFVPLSAAQRVFNAQNFVDEIRFTFADASLEGAKQAEERTRQTLARRHNFDPTDERALWLDNAVENVATFNSVFTGITAFIWFIGIGSLVAGIVGIGNIMLIVVKDRTKEIGIRKAMGATPANVVGQILMEAVFVTAVFGYLGLALGVFMIEGLATVVPGSEFFREPSIDLGTAVQALIAMLVAGTLAGWIPARRAAAIRPIEALRDE